MENDLEPDARCVSLRCAGRGHGIPFPKIAFYCELGVTVAAPTVARLSRMWRDKRRTICQGQMIAKGTDVYLSKIRGGSVSMLFVFILTFGTM